MPLCYLYTNMIGSGIKEGVETRLAKVVAETLGKPLERVSVIIIPGARMFRLGGTALACALTIHSIGVFDAQRNPKYTPPIKKALVEELGLPEERCMLMYQDLDPNFLG